MNRISVWLWLDGPSQREGRVHGPARELALEMNARILANHLAEDADANGVETRRRLPEITCPVTIACGDPDVSPVIETARAATDRIPKARHAVLSGAAHLPYLEKPAAVADLVIGAIP